MKRPILYCAFSFCIGIFFAGLFSIPFGYLLTFTLVLIIMAAVFLKRNILSHIFLYLALVLFGAAYYQNSNILPPNHISHFATEEGRKVSIKGVVVDDPVLKKAFYGQEKISFTMKPSLLIEDSTAQNVVGLLKVDVYCDEKESGPGFGDEIIVKGKLTQPQGLKNPGLFNYSDYLKIKDIYAVFTVNGNDSIQIVKNGSSDILQKTAYILRHKIRDLITNYIDKPYSGFLNAILIGDRNELDSSITDDFIKTGTVHIIAISGLNIVLVAGIFIFIFKIFGIRKKPNIIFTSLAIVFYCFVAGSSPPVVRATAIFVISSIGYIMDRESDILNSLSIAAFFILLLNPKELFDPSFQLSFGSVVSIILFMPKIEEILGEKPKYLIEGISVSIAASAGVFPIVARYFNIVSPIAVISNLIIVPALFIITVVSLIFIFLSFIGATFFLGWFGVLLSLLTQATFYINHIFSQIPFSYMRISAPSPLFLLIYYILLLSFFFFSRRKFVLIIFLIILNLVVWGRGLDAQTKLLRMTFLDVGKGDAILVEFPNRGTMLIDGGSGGIEGLTDMGKNIVAPFLWNKGIRRLDAVVITHFHEDHMGGILYILKNFDIGCVMDNNVPPANDSRLYDEYKKIVKKEGIRRLVLADGDEITGFDDIKLFVINPLTDQILDNDNDSSIVIKLEYENFGTLFCGDISSNVMQRLFSYGELLKSDVLKIPHHGGSMGKENVAYRFFEEVAPKVCVTSSGRKYISNDLSRIYFDIGTVAYSTRKNGAINIITDGLKFEVMPFCKEN